MFDNFPDYIVAFIGLCALSMLGYMVWLVLMGR